MKVLVLHTLPPEATEPGRRIAEFDLLSSAEGVGAALPGAAVCAVRGEIREILDLLARHAPDVVFNLCEAPLGRPQLDRPLGLHEPRGRPLPAGGLPVRGPGGGHRR